jgi:hypothetical protein
VDDIEAEENFKMAADEGDAKGKFNPVIALSQHLALRVDLRTMSRSLRRAVDQGLTFRQVNDAVFLLIYGKESNNEVEAAKYLKSAADREEIYGELKYGFCLLDAK